MGIAAGLFLLHAAANAKSGIDPSEHQLCLRAQRCGATALDAAPFAWLALLMVALPLIAFAPTHWLLASVAPNRKPSRGFTAATSSGDPP
jgi:hypothetical protein